MSAQSGKEPLLSLKNSLKSLLVLFRLTALPVRELTASPSLRHWSPFDIMNSVKLLEWNLLPSLLTFTNSAGLRSLSLLAKENSPTPLLVRAYRGGQTLSTLGPSSSYNGASARRGHPFKKPVGPESFYPARLICPLHLRFLLLYLFFIRQTPTVFYPLSDIFRPVKINYYIAMEYPYMSSIFNFFDALPL